MRTTGKRNNSPPTSVVFKNSVKEIPIRSFGRAIYVSSVSKLTAFPFPLLADFVEKLFE
jgi:hypothetical protein